MTVFGGNRKEGHHHILSRKGEISWIESPILSGYDCITHAFLARQGGVSRGVYATLNVSDGQGDDDTAVARNWSLIADTFALSPRGVRMVRQVHGDDILSLEEDSGINNGGDLPAADGILTSLTGVAIGIKTADCVPLLYADVRQRVAGVVHAGWKGTARGIAAKAVEMLVGNYACRRTDLRVAIGPAIGPCCYEVDETVYAAMPRYQNDRRVFATGVTEGRWMLDLVAANRVHLAAAGVGENHIHAVGICTCCNASLFYSHRGAGGTTGRQLSFIMLHSA